MNADNQPSQTAAAHRTRTPPYIAFKTFLTLLSELKTNGMPPQIDRSVLRRFAGGLQGQILLALRSLDLIDSENRPNERFSALVEAYETDGFQIAMRGVIADAYPYVFKLDLMTATPTMFADAFKDALEAKEDVLRKCRTFFLHAAKEIGIPIGPRIEKAQFPRPNAGNRKARAAKAARLDNGGSLDAEPTVEVKPPHAAPQKELEYQLIDLMAEPDIDDSVKQSIWSLVQYLMARKVRKPS